MVAAIRTIAARGDAGGRLLEDDVIGRLVDPAELEEIQNLLKLGTATYEFVVSRCCYIDNWLHRFRADGGRTVLLLGAGLDSRSCRFPGLGFIEVDSPMAVKAKRELLKTRGIDPQCEVRYVGTDLAAILTAEEPSLGIEIGVLEQPVAVVAEGLVYYLPKEAIGGLFGIVRSHPGVRVILDYMDDRLFERQAPQSFERRIRAEGELVTSLWSVAEMEGLFEQAGLTVLEKVDTYELIRRDFPKTAVTFSSNHIIAGQARVA